MRAQRFRPGFDTLLQRITPSDLTSLGVLAASTAVDTTTPPCSAQTIITDLGPWIVTGDPELPPSDVLQPVVNPLDWG